MDSTGEDRGGFPKRDKGGGERAKRKPVRGAEDDVRKRTKEVAGADAGAGTGAEPEEQTTTLASTVLAKEREKDERKPMSRGLEEVPPFSMANLSSVMTKTMENGFYRFGLLVASWPWTVILASLVVFLVFAPGLAYWRNVTNKVKLWTPYGSQFIDKKRWLDENAPIDKRFELAILARDDGGNILNVENIQYLLKLDKAVSAARGPQMGLRYGDVCLEFRGCTRATLLDAWRNDNERGFVVDEEAIGALTTDQEVLDKINERAKDSEIFKHSLHNLLGRAKRDSNGSVTRAQAIMNIWILNNNEETDDPDFEPVDPPSEDFELGFVEAVVGDDRPGGIPEGTSVYGAAKRSFFDEFERNVNSNFPQLFVGAGLLLTYVTLNLGRFNVLEQRVALAGLGICVIGMSVASSYGFCFYVGSYFADVHPIIPFLLLGIGVDDMFIIFRALSNVSASHPDLPPVQRVGAAMKHAGVSITIASVTDLIAFSISSSTNMPILRAFCFFCAVGLFFLYFYTITFFTACVSIDEQRIAERRLLPFLPPLPESYKPWSLSQEDFGLRCVRALARGLLTPVGRAVVLTMAAGLFGAGVYGAVNLKVDYDALFYMRRDSYPRMFAEAKKRFFPQVGIEVGILVGDIPYWTSANRAAMHRIQGVLDGTNTITKELTINWFDAFDREFCSKEVKECDTEEDFKRNLLLHFTRMHPIYGSSYVTDINLKAGAALTDDTVTLEFTTEEKNLAVAKTLAGDYELRATRISFTHREMTDSEEEVEAMNYIKDSLADIRFEGAKTDIERSPMVYARTYIQWEASWTIAHELLRNVLVAFVVAVLVALIMLASPCIALMIMVSVALTLTNCAGYAYFYGYTVEIVTSILLILCCGLALDYSAHIGVAYLTGAPDGSSRQERARYALVSMGTAIFHGGFSSFLAIVFLAFTNSYVFLSFFNMFSLVIWFGLFHGLCFTPVVLSLLGPIPD